MYHQSICPSVCQSLTVQRSTSTTWCYWHEQWLAEQRWDHKVKGQADWGRRVTIVFGTYFHKKCNSSHRNKTLITPLPHYNAARFTLQISSKNAYFWRQPCDKIRSSSLAVCWECCVHSTVTARAICVQDCLQLTVVSVSVVLCVCILYCRSATCFIQLVCSNPSRLLLLLQLNLTALKDCW